MDYTEFDAEMETLLGDSGQPQQRSAPARSVNEPDPVFIADAWGQYQKQQTRAMQHALGKQPASGPAQHRFPSETAIEHQSIARSVYGAASAEQQDYLEPFGQPTSQQEPAYVYPQQFGQAHWPPQTLRPREYQGWCIRRLRNTVQHPFMMLDDLCLVVFQATMYQTIRCASW